MSRKEVDTKHKALIKQIGAEIKELRSEKDFTYIQMAEEIGISRNAYNLLELGNDYFNISSLLLVLDYHNKSLKEFFQDLKPTEEQ